MNVDANDAAFAANGGVDPLLEDYPVVQYPAVDDAGTLTFAWGDGKAPFYQSLADDTWLLKLQFRVINTQSGNPVVKFTGDPTPVSAVDNNLYDELAVNLIQKQGSTEQDQTDEDEGPIELEVDAETECEVDLLVVLPQGDISCGAEVDFEVKVNGFNGSLSDLQFSLAWDPTQMEYISSSYDPLLYGASGSTDPLAEDVPEIFEFSNDRLVYVWGDGKSPFFQAIPDGSTLFTVKFKVIEASTPISLTIVDDPTEALAVNNYDYDPVKLNRLDDAALVVQGIAPPENIAVIPLNGAALISFEPPPGVDNATYQYKVGSNGVWQNLPEDFTIPQAIITNLDNCEEYSIFLRTMVDGSDCPGIASPAVVVTPSEDNVPLATEWVAGSIDQTSTWNSVAYGGGRFVAVSGTGVNRVARSNDGVNWELIQVELSTWASIAYCPNCGTTGGGRFLAVARGGTTARRVMYSDDNGSTWTYVDMPLNSWQGAAYGNGVFIAVNNDGMENQQVMISENGGVDWNYLDAPRSYWYAIAYGDEKFVAVSRHNFNLPSTPNQKALLVISKIGSTWTTVGLEEPKLTLRTWEGVDYSNGWFVAVSRNGDSRVIRINSTTVEVEDVVTHQDLRFFWRSLRYGKGYLVAVTGDNTAAGRQAMVSRDDGANWERIVTPLARTWNAVGFGDNRFVSLAAGNAQPAAIVSGLIVPDPPVVLEATPEEESVLFSLGEPAFMGNAGSVTYEYKVGEGDWTRFVAPGDLVIPSLVCNTSYTVSFRAENVAGYSCVEEIEVTTESCSDKKTLAWMQDAGDNTSNTLSDDSGNFYGKSDLVCSIQPNPVQGGVTNLMIGLSESTVVLIRVTTTQGAIISSKQLRMESGQHQLPIELPYVGPYVIYVTTTNSTNVIQTIRVY
jgi:hypothetical protein